MDKVDSQPLNPFVQSIYSYEYDDISHIVRMLVIIMEYNKHTRCCAYVSDGRVLWLYADGSLTVLRSCAVRSVALDGLRNLAHSGKLVDIDTLTQYKK